MRRPEANVCGQQASKSVLDHKLGFMLGYLQIAVTLVTLFVTVPAAARNLFKFVYLKFDDSVWAESHGKLLLEPVDPELGGSRHVEMRRAIRVELERQQTAKWLASRVNFSIWAPYLTSLACMAGMLSFGVIGGKYLAGGLAFAGAVVCALGSIWLMVLCTRNFVLNAMLAVHARRQAEIGEVGLPLQQQQIRLDALSADTLSQRQLWRLFKLEWTKQKRRRDRSGGKGISIQDLDSDGKADGLRLLKSH